MPTRAKSRRRVREGTAEYAGGPPRRYLLDTHVWLWWQGADRRLGTGARAAITNARVLHFSAASAWEIAIKQALGKLKLPTDADLVASLARHSVIPLPISVQHAMTAGRLPRVHRDPFDRLLVAQAIEEDLVLLTADAALSRYGVAILDATA